MASPCYLLAAAPSELHNIWASAWRARLANL